MRRRLGNLRIPMLSLVLIAAFETSYAGVIVDDKLIAGPPEDRRVNWVQLTKDRQGNIYASWGNRIYNGKDASHFQRFDVYGNRNSPHIEKGGVNDPEGTVLPARIAVDDRSGRIAIGWTYFFSPAHPDPRFAGYVQCYDSTWHSITDTVRITEHTNDVVLNGIEFDDSLSFTVLVAPGGINVMQRLDSLGGLAGDTIQITFPWPGNGAPADTFPCWSGDTLYECDGAADPWMDRLENGDLIVAWWGAAFVGTEIKTGYPSFRLFSTSLNPLDYPRVFSCDGYPCTVSDSLLGWGAHPFVAALPGSRFVVTYYQGYLFLVSSLPYVRVYRSDGTPITPAFNAADAFPDYPYMRVKPVAADDGTFVVIWSDYRYGGSGLNLFAQRFDTLGNPIGVNHLINNVRGSLGGNYDLYDAAIVDSFLVAMWVDNRDFPTSEGLLYMQTMTLSSVGRVVVGDVDVNDSINSADIILTVNYVFKSGAFPQPQPLAADVTGNCSVTSADIIHLVNYVFKAGPAPINGGCLIGPL